MSKHRIYPNPLHLEDTKNHYVFIKHAYDYLEKQKNIPIFGISWDIVLSPYKMKFIIDNLYWQGKVLYKYLKCSYQEFSDYLTSGRIPRSCWNYTEGYWSNYWIRYWDRDICIHFRKKLSYQKKENHSKKEKTEEQIAKDDWRDKKGFKKDQAKCHKRRGCPKDWKKQANRDHRAWERHNIDKANWTELANTKKYKGFQDPWLWD